MERIKRKVKRLARSNPIKRIARETDPIREAIRKILNNKVCKVQRRYTPLWVERELDEEKEYITKKSEEYGIEIPTLLAQLDIALSNYPNMCIWQALELVVLKKKRITR